MPSSRMRQVGGSTDRIGLPCRGVRFYYLEILVGSTILATKPPQRVQTPLSDSIPFSTCPLTAPMLLDFMHATHQTLFKTRKR